MRWHLAVLGCLTILAAITTARAGCDCQVAVCRSDQEETSWIFRPSYFSHDPDTGQRVAQYEPERTSYYRDDPTYMESGYRHYEYEIYGPGGAADHLHVVQTWGLGDLIRPYGEWEYPYRAGATPYGPWGNPQGPWTLPFDSWVNPYGLLQHMQGPGWGPGPYRPGPGPGTAVPYGGMPGYGAANGPGYGSGSGYGGGMGYGAGYGHGGVTIPATPPNPGLGNY
jgi:hypothetical protein